MNGFIYKITNDINDKIYVGKTLSSIEERLKEHKSDSERKKMEHRPLYSAMRKYGIDHFFIEKIEEVPIEQLSDREIYWIKTLNSYHDGYNATLGGDGKQLYDYDAIVKGFLSGKLIKELAEEFECCGDTISAALKLASIDSTVNGRKSCYKSLVAKNLNGETIKDFSSRAEAVKWLQSEGFTKSTNVDNISATIGRAANGKRATAYGMKWENLG